MELPRCRWHILIVESVFLVHSACAEMVDNVWKYGKRGTAGWEMEFIDCSDPFFFFFCLVMTLGIKSV